jgi:hypothetical protein
VTNNKLRDWAGSNLPQPSTSPTISAAYDDYADTAAGLSTNREATFDGDACRSYRPTHLGVAGATQKVAEPMVSDSWLPIWSSIPARPLNSQVGVT